MSLRNRLQEIQEKGMSSSGYVTTKFPTALRTPELTFSACSASQERQPEIDERAAATVGHKVLQLPPYYSQFIPIELV